MAPCPRGNRTLKDCLMTAARFKIVYVALLLAVCFIGCARAQDGSARSADLPHRPQFKTESIPTDRALYPYNHAASLVELPDGELLVAWGAGSRELASDTVILLSRLSPDSKEWSKPVVVSDRPDKADANPVLFVDKKKKLWLFHVEMFGPTFCLGKVVVQTSADAGHTWTPARPALKAMCVMVRNKPIITRSGRWVLPGYVEGVYQSQFWLSDDHGASWTATPPLLTTRDNNLQPTVVELKDGTLLSLMRSGGEAHQTWEGRSSDGGKTWSLKQRPDLPNPGSGIDMTRLSTGELVLAYNPNPDDRRPLSVAWSDDEGRSWSPPRNITDDPVKVSYPSIIQSRDGLIHVAYSHQLDHIEHAFFNRAWLREKK